MQQKYIDIGLAFAGAAIGIAADMHQYNGKIGVGALMAPIIFPAIAYRVWNLIHA